MQDNKDRIKELAGSVLRSFEAEPPEDMWGRIEQQSLRRKRMLIFRYAGMAASIVILLGLGFALLMPGGQQDMADQELVEPGKSTPREVASTQSAGNAGDPVRAPQTVQAETVSAQEFTRQMSGNQTNVPDVDIERPVYIVSAEMQSAGIQDTTTAFAEAAVLPGGTLHTYAKDSMAVAVDLAATPQAKDVAGRDDTPVVAEHPPVSDQLQGKNWELAMGYGTTPALDITQEEYALNSPGSNFSYDDLSAEVANETSYFQEVENTTHNAPVTLGILISRRLARRWNIESGLTYTKLGYTIRTSEMNSDYREYRNELYYLGIPVGIRFGLLDRRRFGIYGTQSFLLEKGIAGRGYTDTYEQGILTASSGEHIGIRGVQLSSLTGLGAEFKVTGKISVYGQSGVQLFFMNGSQPYNIRSARIVWPSFQAGLRLWLD